MKHKHIPHFEIEEEELAFWDEHDVSEFDHEVADDVVIDVSKNTEEEMSNMADVILCSDCKSNTEAIRITSRGVVFNSEKETHGSDVQLRIMVPTHRDVPCLLYLIARGEESKEFKYDQAYMTIRLYDNMVDQLIDALTAITESKNTEEDSDDDK